VTRDLCSVIRVPWKSGGEEVDSPDRVGIFDRQLKVEWERGKRCPGRPDQVGIFEFASSGQRENGRG
jgi:hypothetical protein